MSAKIPWGRAIFIILGTTALISGSAAFTLLYSMNFQARRMIDPKYTVTAVVQCCRDGEPLFTEYLTELLELSVDHPLNLYQIHTDEAAKRLLKQPLIREAEVRRAPPSTLFVIYTTRVPVAYLGDQSNMAVDKEGFVFPFHPFLKPKELPVLYYGEQVGWGEKLQGVKGALALKLIQELGSRWGHSVRLIDVSSSDAPSQGKRQIVAMVDSHVLRLSVDRFKQELANYQQLKKINGINARVIDFRIEQLAFIEKRESYTSGDSKIGF